MVTSVPTYETFSLIKNNILHQSKFYKNHYPHVSKSLRGIFGKDKNHHHKESGHCCGMMAMAEQGLGYPDLDDLKQV
jgi:hypothetical protein